MRDVAEKKRLRGGSGSRLCTRYLGYLSTVIFPSACNGCSASSSLPGLEGSYRPRAAPLALARMNATAHMEVLHWKCQL